MGGISPISQQEILAWQSNHGVRLTPWELEVLQLFDQITISILSKSPKAAESKT